MVREYPLVMNGQVTYEDLNVLPPISYDILIGMDWLGAHRGKIDFYNKTFACLNEEGNLRVVKGIPNVISRRNYSAMQLKKFYGKGCRVYPTHVLEAMMLLGWRVIMWYKNSGMFLLMKFLGFLQRGTLILPLNFFQVKHQCPRHPIG